MSTIMYPCGQCGRRHEFTSAEAGSQVFCDCGSLMTIPVPKRATAPAAPAPTAAVSGHVKFPCGVCGQRYEVAASLAGKRFHCRKCGTKSRVPAATGPANAAVVYAELTPPPRPSPSPVAARTPRPRPAAPEPARGPDLFELDDDAPMLSPIQDDPYGLDEVVAPAAAPPAAAAERFPQRLGAPTRSGSSARSGRGRNAAAIGGGIGSGVLVAIVIAVRVAIAVGSQSLGGNGWAANEAKVTQCRLDYNNAAHELIALFGTVHDVPTATEADPKAQGLLRRMDAANRTAAGLKVSLEYARDAKQKAMSTVQVEGQQLGNELRRVMAIPGASTALEGTFAEIQRLAEYEQTHSNMTPL